MGTTLENGVYLPSEGERNCYAGLKTNWEILDQKVADVTALQQAVAGALHREIVESLPSTDIDPNTIYMILSGTSATENVYNEFMYVNNAWELIGTSATDLTNYYTKGDVDGLLLLKANASDLTSHTGDTTIHVTTADKNRWNNQTYVFRYSSTALVASSTNSNTLLDKTDNLKVGDKVIDSDGVLFSVTAIDTANSTFTIGTALIDLAKDSDVVHKSGDETVGGVKTFSNDIIRGYTTIASRVIKGSSNTPAIGSNGVGFIQNQATLTYLDSTPKKDITVTLEVQDSNYTDGKSRAFYPNSNNIANLGKSGKRWANVYATNYYYGGSEIEFSQKFVTTDTDQTISGVKTFNGFVPINGAYMGNEPSTTFRTVLSLRSRYDTAGKSGWLVSKFRSNSAQGALSGSDTVFLNFDVLENEVRTNGILRFNLSSWSGNTPGRFSLIPNSAIESYLGTSGNKWATINGLEPSALGMPDLSNGVDISSYLTNIGTTTPSEYTPSVNGWVVLKMSAPSGSVVIRVSSDNGIDNYSYTERTDVGGLQSDGGYTYEKFASCTVPCLKNDKLSIYIMPSTAQIVSAKFFPCQGNV